MNYEHIAVYLYVHINTDDHQFKHHLFDADVAITVSRRPTHCRIAMLDNYKKFVVFGTLLSVLDIETNF